MTISVTHYADVRVTGDGVPQIVGILVTRFHGFLAHRGVRMAIAFPRYKAGDRPKIGEVLRFFGDRQVLEDWMDDLDGDERDRWMCGRVKETPEHDNVAVYLRRALPRRPTEKTRSVEAAMRRRMRSLEEMREWPFFFVRSQSGDLSFPCTVEKRRIPKEKLAEMHTSDWPNAYGFSTATRIVPVPEF